MTQLPYELIGKTLHAVRVLEFRFHDESGPSACEGVAFDFDDTTLIIQAINDTSELTIHTGDFVPDTESLAYGQYVITDKSDAHPFVKFKNLHVSEWWTMQNSRNYAHEGFFQRSVVLVIGIDQLPQLLQRWPAHVLLAQFMHLIADLAQRLCGILYDEAHHFLAGFGDPTPGVVLYGAVFSADIAKISKIWLICANSQDGLKLLYRQQKPRFYAQNRGA